MAKQYGIVKIDYITYTTGGDGFEGDRTIDVSGLANISDSGITVTGTISGISGIFSENIFVNGTGIFNDLYVTGNTILSGNTSISGDLTVSGNSTFSGITVTGEADFQDNVTISGDLGVSGTTTLNALLVTGDATFSGNTGISGELTVSSLTATGDLDVQGNLTVSGTISGATDGGVYGSGYWKVPAGTTAERPGTAVTGMIRYNETISQFEGFDGNWSLLGGGATGSGGDRVFVLNETGVTTDYTLTGFNASSAGPITIEDGVDVIIADDYNWAIV